MPRPLNSAPFSRRMSRRMGVPARLRPRPPETAETAETAILQSVCTPLLQLVELQCVLQR